MLSFQNLGEEEKHLNYYIKYACTRFGLCYRDKEDEIKRLQEMNKNQLMQSEKSLEEFKLQVEKNQTRMYDEMKQQVRNQEAAWLHSDSVIVVENGSLNSFYILYM